MPKRIANMLSKLPEEKPKSGKSLYYSIEDEATKTWANTEAKVSN